MFASQEHPSSTFSASAVKRLRGSDEAAAMECTARARKEESRPKGTVRYISNELGDEKTGALDAHRIHTS